MAISVVVKELWPAFIILLVAAIVQTIDGASADVSWLITLCEKILDGQKPYVDFIETNPPGAIYIYWPATAAARLVGLQPELTAPFFGFLAIVAALYLCAKIFAFAKLDARLGPSGLAFAAAILALLPGREFDQREHVAIILGLPFFAALIARASSAQIGIALRLLASFCGALMMTIKPHFALMIVCVSPYLFWRLGPRKFVASVELWSAAGLLILYLALIASFFPDYLDRIAPMAASIYAPIRAPFAALALQPGPVCWLTLGATLVVFDRRRLAEPLIAIPALGSVGAIIAYFIQGKGWPYHCYPALALMALAAGPLLLRMAASPLRWRGAAILAYSAFSLSLAFVYFSPPAKDVAALERLVRAVATRPKVLAIGPDIALGHPLTRRVSGVWAGTANSLWITAMTQYLMRSGPLDEATQRRYESYLAFDRATLTSDIERKSPDVILVDGDKWKAWAFSRPDVAAALAAYAPVGAVGEVTVYGRKVVLPSSQEVNSGSGRP